MTVPWENNRPQVFLRLKALNPDVLKMNEKTLVMATTMEASSHKIIIRPCQLEWFDGVEWVPVKFEEGT